MKYLILVSVFASYFGLNNSTGMNATIESSGHTQESKNDTTFVFTSKGMTLKAHYFHHTDSLGLNMGTILLLPGWNYSVLDWCTKTSFCEKAKKLGYNLVMLDMSKSVYASQVYPETRADMVKYVTRTWLKDSIIPYFQEKYDALVPGKNNYVLGLSTGARGAALLALDMPEVFTKAAALSGDYNQEAIPNDNLMRIFYGPIKLHKERWTGEDNVVSSIDRYNVPIYIGHGLKDNVVPVSQSQEFYKKLLEHKPNLDVRLHIDSTAKHDYLYWDSEVNNVLGFFLD